MSNTRFKAFMPTVCDACSAVRDAEAIARERKRRITATIPFPCWDPLRGNAQTLRAVLDAATVGRSVYLCGDTGSGKTRSLCQAAVRAMSSGVSLEWRNCAAWLDSLAAMAGDCMQDFVKAKGAAVQGGVLVLDDLGKGRLTDRTAAAVFDVVDTALRLNCCLWVTTNLPPESLEGKFGSEYGAPLVRRLVDVCVGVNV